MTIVGLVFILAGGALLVLPGPGLVLILAGLAILGTEYEMARRAQRRLLVRVRQSAARARGGSREYVTTPPSQRARPEGGIEPPLPPPH